jgi:hypothetical protein
MLKRSPDRKPLARSSKFLNLAKRFANGFAGTFSESTDAPPIADKSPTARPNSVRRCCPRSSIEYAIALRKSGAGYRFTASLWLEVLVPVATVWRLGWENR